MLHFSTYNLRGRSFHHRRLYDNPSLVALQQRGEEFEKDYIRQRKESGETVVEISRGDTKEAIAQTLEAIKRGVDIIYQARLEQDCWNGWADFLN